MRKRWCFVAFALTTMCVCGCAKNSRDAIMDAPASQVAMRAYQSRLFDTGDKEKTLRAVIATLQDLDFVIDKADVALGSISGSKAEGGTTRITVTVHPKSQDQVSVRANAQLNNKTVDNPEYYQSFFDALGKALFLSAHMDE